MALGRLATFLAASVAAQPVRPPSLEDVVTRAGQYAVDYGRALTSVLAEEAYTQRLVWRRGHSPLQERGLRSEIAFVRLTDSTDWLAFRNVLTVDDAPVPYSEGRLERVLRGSERSLLAEARSIASESARYNIGPITREINVPTTALHFVHPLHRSNCRFEKEGEESVDGETVWIVRFKERDRGGLITRTDGRNLPAEGRLWILPSDGRIVRSELVVKDFVRGRRLESGDPRDLAAGRCARPLGAARDARTLRGSVVGDVLASAARTLRHRGRRDVLQLSTLHGRRADQVTALGSRLWLCKITLEDFPRA